MPSRRKVPFRFQLSKKKPRRRRKNIGIGRTLGLPVPTKLKTTMTYVTALKLTPPAAGTADINVYSANNMYDPDISGVGAQPRAFDQLMALYDHYVVAHSKISVSFVNTSSAEANVCFIRLKDTSTEDNDLINNLEASYCKYRVYGVNQLQTGRAMDYKLTHKCNVSKFLGRKNILSDPELKGSTSSNFTEQAYYHVGAVGLDQSNAGGVTDILVTIQYTAWLIEPKNPSQS